MLLSLWLPILLSGIAVFVASAIAWMALPFHRTEWQSLPNAAETFPSIAKMGIAPGQYIFPGMDDDPERQKSGPWGTLSIWVGQPSMGMNMLQSLVFYWFASFCIAYLATLAIPSGADFMKVFRFVGTAGILTYCFAGIPNGIWFKRKLLWDVVDGIAFALLTGVIFALLWPKA